MLPVAITIGEKERVYQLPQAWAECTPVQALLCLRSINRAGDATTQALRALQGLLPISRPTWMGMTVADVHALSKQVAWIHGPAGPQSVIPYFRYRREKYLFPKPKAETWTALEYALAEDMFEGVFNPDHTEQQQVEHMLQLTALVARERNPNRAQVLATGDERAPVRSREEVIDRTHRLVGLPPEYQHAALLYWLGVKEYIHNLYGQWLFQGEDQADTDDLDTDPEPNPASGNLFGWWGLYMDVAEKGVFGNLEAVHHTNFHTVCMFMVKQVQASRDMKQEMRRQQLRAQTPNRNDQ